MKQAGRTSNTRNVTTRAAASNKRQTRPGPSAPSASKRSRTSGSSAAVADMGNSKTAVAHKKQPRPKLPALAAFPETAIFSEDDLDRVWNTLTPRYQDFLDHVKPELLGQSVPRPSEEYWTAFKGDLTKWKRQCILGKIME